MVKVFENLKSMQERLHKALANDPVDPSDKDTMLAKEECGMHVFDFEDGMQLVIFKELAWNANKELAEPAVHVSAFIQKESPLDTFTGRDIHGRDRWHKQAWNRMCQLFEATWECQQSINPLTFDPTWYLGCTKAEKMSGKAV